VNDNDYPHEKRNRHHIKGFRGGTWTNDEVATSAEIVACFEAIPHGHVTAYNWGTAGDRDLEAEWHVTAETYINGVVLIVDHDYWMGYLLECVDRTSGVVTFVAVNLYHGRKADGSYEHDYITYEPDCGTFFERTDAADVVTVGHWAISVIHGMAESWFEARRNR